MSHRFTRVSDRNCREILLRSLQARTAVIMRSTDGGVKRKDDASGVRRRVQTVWKE